MTKYNYIQGFAAFERKALLEAELTYRRLIDDMKTKGYKLVQHNHDELIFEKEDKEPV